MMKKRLALTLCVIASLGAAIPCGERVPPEITFNEIQAGSYRQLLFGFGTHGVVSITTQSGECFDVREVDQMIHHDILGERAIAVDEPLLIDFEGQDNWGIVLYLGADTFDVDRHPQLQCYAAPRVATGGDYGLGLFGPEAYIDEQGEDAWPFQYLFYLVYRQSFGDYVPFPIDYCTLEPDGEGVFVSVMQYVVDAEEGPAKAALGRRMKSDPKGDE